MYPIPPCNAALYGHMDISAYIIHLKPYNGNNNKREDIYLEIQSRNVVKKSIQVNS